MQGAFGNRTNAKATRSPLGELESSDAIPDASTTSALTEEEEGNDSGFMDQASGQAEGSRRAITHSGPASTSATAVPHGTSWIIGHMMSQCQRASRADHMAEREAIAPEVEQSLKQSAAPWTILMQSLRSNI